MLKAIYSSAEEIPAEVAGFYTERDGQFELQVEGMKTSGDVDRLTRALENERSAHRSTKESYSWVGDLNAGEVQSLRDAREDLQYKLDNASPTMDDDAIEARAEKLAGRATRKLEDQLAAATLERDAHLNAIGLHEAAQGQRLIKDSVEKAIGEGGIKLSDGAMLDVVPFAERIMQVQDGRVVSREGVDGIESGLGFGDVLADIQASGRRAHWFPASAGAGAQGGTGNDLGSNPFSSGNLTEIGQAVQADPAKARQLAKAAGVDPAKYGL